MSFFSVNIYLDSRGSKTFSGRYLPIPIGIDDDAIRADPASAIENVYSQAFKMGFKFSREYPDVNLEAREYERTQDRPENVCSKNNRSYYENRQVRLNVGDHVLTPTGSVATVDDVSDTENGVTYSIHYIHCIGEGKVAWWDRKDLVLLKP